VITNVSIVAVRHSHPKCLKNLRVRYLYGAYRTGNDFELIPAVKMKTRHPVEGSFDSEFPSIYNQCGVMDA